MLNGYYPQLVLSAIGIIRNLYYPQLVLSATGIISNFYYSQLVLSAMDIMRNGYYPQLVLSATGIMRNGYYPQLVLSAIGIISNWYYPQLVLSATGIRNWYYPQLVLSEINYTKDLSMTVKSELNAKNKITAIEALAVPVLRCSFGVVNWRLEDVRKSDRRTRAILKLFKLHHPEADEERRYVKRNEGARGVFVN
jgi:hypothetical protein